MAFAFWDDWRFVSRLSSVEASQTVGAEIAPSRTTSATRVSERAPSVRARMPTCRVIAAPAAIRNQPAYGLVATAIRQPSVIGHRY